ncbi:MAG: hypothetical protein IKB72_04955 [Ruminococcus sp.]|nr:hypothetical protein [Ruminococcus sp.]
MKRILSIILILAVTLCFSACYKIDSNSKSDYSAFYDKMGSILPETQSMFPHPEVMESIDDIYLYYSDYDLLDSFYTIYLECSFTSESFETEKQRVHNECGPALLNSDSFSYESEYIEQFIEQDSDSFTNIQLSYVLFDKENNKIIYVATFEKAYESKLKTSNIPSKYLPKELNKLLDEESTDISI